MHFRGRNRDGQGDVSSPADGGNGNDNGAAGAVVDEEALTPAMVELTRHQQHNENEEQQELVVQVPTNTSTTSTQSFVLPAIGWELSEEAIALRREAIHREVRFYLLYYSCIYPITFVIAFLYNVTNMFYFDLYFTRTGRKSSTCQLYPLFSFMSRSYCITNNRRCCDC
jgi:hypothetical protein